MTAATAAGESHHRSPVTAAQIVEVTAWCRRLSAARPAASDPAALIEHRDQIAAYLAAKADLLARIADQRAAEYGPDYAHEARQVADNALAVAQQAAAALNTPQKTGKDIR